MDTGAAIAHRECIAHTQQTARSQYLLISSDATYSIIDILCMHRSSTAYPETSKPITKLSGGDRQAATTTNYSDLHWFTKALV